MGWNWDKNPPKAYHRGMCELDYISRVFQRGLNCENNPLKAYHRVLCELYCVPWGYHLGLHCDKDPLKGISPWDVWAWLYILKLSTWVQMAIRTLKRPMTVGCVSFTLFHEDNPWTVLRCGPPKRSIIVGFVILTVFPEAFNMGLIGDKNPLKGLSPWDLWSWLYFLRLSTLIKIVIRTPWKACHRGLYEHYGGRWGYQRGLYCD
jgi:hypothetical protein